MSSQTSVAIGEHFTGFIDEQVRDGRYGSADEVIRAGLRLLEEHEVRRKALIDAIREGEESGPAVPFDFDEFMAEMNQKHGI